MMVWEQKPKRMQAVLNERSPLCSETGNKGNFCLIGKREGLDVLMYLSGGKAQARIFSGGDEEALVCVHLAPARAKFTAEAEAYDLSMYMIDTHPLLEYNGRVWDQTLDLREKV
jgi:hypothetical protein